MNVDDLDKLANELLMLHATVNSGSIATVWPSDMNFVSLQETIENQALLTSVLSGLQSCKVLRVWNLLICVQSFRAASIPGVRELSLKDQR